MPQNIILDRMLPVLDAYQPPGSEFEAQREWEQTYELFSAPMGPFWTNGELRLRRQSSAGGGCRITADCRRRGSPGFSFFVHAEFECTAGAPAPVLRWTSSSKMAAAAGDAPYLNSGLSKQGRVSGGMMEVRTGSQALRTRVHGACLAKWCLIDAIQRLPRERGPHSFSLLDEVDEVRPGHELRYRGEEQVAMGGGTRALGVFEHLGAGVIPASYWIDGQNRVLFVVSGVEISVLKESNGGSASYTLRNPPVRPL